MKKNFTKFLILGLIAATSLAACKKSSDNKPSTSNYSMTLNANGTAVSYSSCVVADIDANGSKYTEIVGVNQKTPNNSFSIEIVAGTSSLKAGQTYQVTADYLGANTATLFYDTDDTHSYTTQAANPVGSVTITSVTSTTLKGTFSGKLYSGDDYNAADLKYTITSGSFVGQMPQ